MGRYLGPRSPPHRHSFGKEAATPPLSTTSRRPGRSTMFTSSRRRRCAFRARHQQPPNPNVAPARRAGRVPTACGGRAKAGTRRAESREHGSTRHAQQRALLHWRSASVGGEGGGMMPRRCRPVPAAARSAFAGFRFPPEIIVLSVRWYLRYGLSHRDVEELLAERGIEVDHIHRVPVSSPVHAVVGRFGPGGRSARPDHRRVRLSEARYERGALLLRDCDPSAWRSDRGGDRSGRSARCCDR